MARETIHVSTGVGLALGGLVVGGIAGFTFYGLLVRKASPSELDAIARAAGRPGGVMCPPASPATPQATTTAHPDHHVGVTAIEYGRRTT